MQSLIGGEAAERSSLFQVGAPFRRVAAAPLAIDPKIEHSQYATCPLRAPPGDVAVTVRYLGLRQPYEHAVAQEAPKAGELWDYIRPNKLLGILLLEILRSAGLLSI